jgi:hypothetical protein
LAQADSPPPSGVMQSTKDALLKNFPASRVAALKARGLLQALVGAFLVMNATSWGFLFVVQAFGETSGFNISAFAAMGMTMLVVLCGLGFARGLRAARMIGLVVLVAIELYLVSVTALALTGGILDKVAVSFAFYAIAVLGTAILVLWRGWTDRSRREATDHSIARTPPFIAAFLWFDIIPFWSFPFWLYAIDSSLLAGKLLASLAVFSVIFAATALVCAAAYWPLSLQRT